MSGVDSVAELEGLLTEENVEVPARTNFGDAGCFIRGAGIYESYQIVLLCCNNKVQSDHKPVSYTL